MAVEFALADRQIDQIARLLKHLEKKKVPANVSLEAVRHVPGWWIQNSKSKYSRAKIWEIWTPDDRHPDVPWAFTPCMHVGNRDWAVLFLKGRWVKDAIEVLEHDARAALIHEPE